MTKVEAPAQMGISVMGTGLAAETATVGILFFAKRKVPKAFGYVCWLKKILARPGRMVKVSQTVLEVGLK
jgi:hypothetical protein